MICIFRCQHNKLEKAKRDLRSKNQSESEKEQATDNTNSNTFHIQMTDRTTGGGDHRTSRAIRGISDADTAQEILNSQMEIMDAIRCGSSSISARNGNFNNSISHHNVTTTTIIIIYITIIII